MENPTPSAPDLFARPAHGPNWRSWTLLTLLFIAALFSRGWHFDSDFDHPDEPIAVKVNQALEHTWDTNWKRAPGMPPHFATNQYNFSAYHYAVHGWHVALRAVLPSTLVEVREGLLSLRLFSVLCGALAVLWAYRVGRRLAGEPAGWVAALFTLANPQLIADAHYARCEAMVTWLTLVIVELCLMAPKRMWALRLAALLVGLISAAKVSMAALMLVPVLAVWLGASAPAAGLARGRGWLVAWMQLIGLAAVGFVIGAPGAVIHPHAFIEGVSWLMNQYGGFHAPHSMFDGGVVAGALAEFYMVTFGAGVVALLIWGIAAHWKNARVLIGLTIPVVFYVGYFASKKVFFERNLSHVIPLALILGALGLLHVVGRLGLARRGALVSLGLAAIVSWPSLRWSWYLDAQAFSGIESQKSAALEKVVYTQYQGLLPQKFSMTFPEDTMRLRNHFVQDASPVLIDFSEFNDSFTRHYREALAQEFLVYQVGRFEPALAAVPCSALTVYHGPSKVFWIVVGRRWPGPGVAATTR